MIWKLILDRKENPLSFLPNRQKLTLWRWFICCIQPFSFCWANSIFFKPFLETNGRIKFPFSKNKRLQLQKLSRKHRWILSDRMECYNAPHKLTEGVTKRYQKYSYKKALKFFENDFIGENFMRESTFGDESFAK